MKNLEKVLMILAGLSAVFSIIINIETGGSIGWQIATILWILTNYLKTMYIEKIESK